MKTNLPAITIAIALLAQPILAQDTPPPPPRGDQPPTHEPDENRPLRPREPGQPPRGPQQDRRPEPPPQDRPAERQHGYTPDQPQRLRPLLQRAFGNGERPNPPRMEKRPFLGIETAPLDEGVAPHIGLQIGFGLIVRDVLDDSPAKQAGIERDDLLILLDDQKLTTPDHLRLLTKAAGKDKEITLTLRRRGEEKKITIKLTEREIPVPIQRTLRDTAAPFLGNLNRPPAPGDHAPERGDHPRNHTNTTSFTTTRNVSTLADEHGTITINTTDDHTHLTILGKDGGEIFNGPINNEQDRAKLPPAWHEKVKSLLQKTPPRPDQPPR